MLSTNEIRSAFLDYFKSKGHTVVESAPLLPKGDPSLLFVNSGMVPFKECFRGLETRPYTRAASCQKSLRVSGKHNDYEQIGQTARHHTFFEMLGNFSLGDYFKSDAIKFAWEFITEVLKMPKDLLWVTVHNSDDEAEKLWLELTGISPERIVRLGDDTNLWMMGDFGPRGYSSEIFYYMGSDPANQSREEFLKDDGTYLEFWNLVFMQFNRNQDGTVTNLPKPCIDTGAGLERIASILQGKKSNFDSDELRFLIGKLEEISGVKYDGSSYEACDLPAQQWRQDIAMRVIADHARSIAFLIADGVAPSNEKEGYVLRRLIRRATLRGDTLGISEPFLTKITDQVVKRMSAVYPELAAKKDLINELTADEEKQFRKTLSSGLKVLSEVAEKLNPGEMFPGDVAFKLHDTFGFPLDLTEDVLKEQKLAVDQETFSRLMAAQKERSRVNQKADQLGSIAIKELLFDGKPTEFIGHDTLTAESSILAIKELPVKDTKLFAIALKETPFYAEMGGQIGDRGTLKIKDLELHVIDTQKNVAGQFFHVVLPNEDQDLSEKLIGEKAYASIDQERRSLIEQHHSGTHLLGAALRKLFGEQVEQRGSLVSDKKLRFDFTHRQAITPEQLQEVQDLINGIIQADYPVNTKTMPIAAAKKLGAVAVFGEKYGEEVRVVEMGPLSIELCGGTHVKSTGNIGFEILLSEGSISTGIRRIEAVAGKNALVELSSMQQSLAALSKRFKTNSAELAHKVEQLFEQNSKLEHEIKQRDLLIANIISAELVGRASSLSDSSKVVISNIDISLDRDGLMQTAEQTLARLQSGAVVIGNNKAGNLAICISKDLAKKHSAGNIAKAITSNLGGKGGGKPESASLVQIPTENFQRVLELAKSELGLA